MKDTKKKYAYKFENVTNRQLIIGWLFFIPMYFYILKYIIVLPIVNYFQLGGTQEVSYLIGNIIFQTLMFLGLIVLEFPIIKQSLEEIKCYKVKKILKSVGSGFLIMLGVILIFAVIQYIQFQGKVVLSQNETSLRSIREIAPIPVFIMTVLLGPFVEEMIFRVIIFRTLRKIHSIIGIIGSALAFGFIHIEKVILQGDFSAMLTMTSYIGMGIALALIYEKKKNILICVAIHMIYNAIVLIMH